MGVEKIIYLVALAVYGILSVVLSIVRTLKTSKISSDVKAVLPPIDDEQSTADEQSTTDEQSTGHGKPINDEQDVQNLTIDEVLSVISEFLNRNR